MLGAGLFEEACSAGFTGCFYDHGVEREGAVVIYVTVWFFSDIIVEGARFSCDGGSGFCCVSEEGVGNVVVSEGYTASSECAASHGMIVAVDLIDGSMT